MKVAAHHFYQPKASMCMTCCHRDRNCQHLDFSSMKPIKEEIAVVIVKCTDFKRATTHHTSEKGEG